ncbi:RHS repeat domain-containing protein [Flavobacterium chungangensis]|uniref:RHS repeat domain-containing protein n=1 Tax=Flavobacterium chungangensis TaxID=2708132 RepID=A0ABV8Z8W1_9FLAO
MERQTANLEAKSKKITYEYEFNRLTNIHYPENPQNDVRYVFGSKNESQNRKGRLILMEDATGAQEFSYGVMGEIESIRRTVIVPNSAIATYVTSWKYDSWNRLQEMIYPDQEKINYTYNSGGLLQAVAGKKAYSYNYVNKIGYDKFEQRSYLKYCNGTETKYNYEPLRRRLDNMTVASGTGYQGNNTPRMFMNNNYQYDKVSNVLNVTNSAAGVSNKMGGAMSHNYAYDNLYQLISANGIYTGADQKTANYSLEMKYDDLHNIVSKTQNVMQNKVTETGILKAGYTMNYNYNSTNKHQLDNVTETEYRTKNTDPKVDKNKNNKYVYDKNGNMIYVNTEEVKTDGKVNEKAQEKKFIWDEENRLGAVDINGYVSSYTYDAGGERVTKLSGGGQGIFVNSVFSGGKTSTSDFTLYVNPYLVAQNGGRYTKHIYIGSQRIVSKLGDFDSYGADPRRVEKAGESFSGVKVNYDAKYKKSLDVVKANYATFEVPYYGVDNNDYVNGLGFCCNPSGESASASSSSTTGKLMAGKNDNAELQQFYYHPDHLGSSSYISNLDGEVVQHVEYVPFGEVFLEEKNAKWNTPYLFTSKEIDRETGLYYYGARYMDSKMGIFISVDPLAEKYAGVSSYAYALNNPVKFTDPTGMSPENDYGIDKAGNITLTKTTNDKTDRLIAENGDVIADNVRKGILQNNTNISQNGLTLTGNSVRLNASVGEFIMKLSLYEQKEISWGLYSKDNGNGILVNVLPYSDNEVNEGINASQTMYYGDRTYSLEIGNHTHPGIWGRTYGGKWLLEKGGGSSPSDADLRNASKAKLGNLIWNRYGISHYNSDGIIDKPSYSNGLIRNYYDNNSVLDLNYIQNTLKWKKSFSTSPSH